MNFDYCEGKVHVVKEGDTLYKISRMHEVPIAMLMRANPYVDVYNLQIGTEVCVPVMPEIPTMPQPPAMPQLPSRPNRPIRPNIMNRPASPEYPNMPRPITMPQMNPDISDSIISYVVREGDTLNGILDRFDIEMEDLLNFNNLDDIFLQSGTTLKIPENNDEEFN